MTTNIEIEYKTLVSKEQFEKMLKVHSNYKLISQTNTYFQSDDPNNPYCSIRIRSLEDKFLFTCKIPQEIGLLEKECWTATNDVTELENTEISDFFKEVHINGPFYKEAELHTERHMVDDQYGELCMDENTYLNGSDYEIEFELHNGVDPEEGLKHFIQLLDECNIEYIPNKISKHQRAVKGKEKC